MRLITAATGIITTFAGAGGTTYNQQEQGAPTAMNISSPSGLVPDVSGNLFIADAALNRIFFVAIAGYAENRRVGLISTVAGTSGSGAYTTAALEENAYATSAHLNAPHALATDSSGAVVCGRHRQ